MVALTENIFYYHQTRVKSRLNVIYFIKRREFEGYNR